MYVKKIGHRVAVIAFFIILLGLAGFRSEAYAAGSATTDVLEYGMKSDVVAALQRSLKDLNFFNAEATGYFGIQTKKSVISFQKSNGLTADGVVGPKTADALFNRRLMGPVGTVAASRSGVNRSDTLLPWFDGVEDILKIGTAAVVTDVDTGISFSIVRTGGISHSDTETLSLADTELLYLIYDGKWSWSRRAVIVTIGHRKIAASMAGMPHAGRDDLPAREVVSDRSDGYGTGLNYDSIKGNGMNGHFDIHFLGSRTHGTDRIDEKHQAMVMKAAASMDK